MDILTYFIFTSAFSLFSILLKMYLTKGLNQIKNDIDIDFKTLLELAAICIIACLGISVISSSTIQAIVFSVAFGAGFFSLFTVSFMEVWRR